MYEFIKEQLHPKIPNLFGWWLVVTPDAMELHEKLHKMVTVAAFMGWGKDPHEFNADGTMLHPERPSPKQAAFGNPVGFGARWFGITMANLIAGRSLLVNNVGGWHPFSDAIIIVAHEFRQRLEWPSEKEGPFTAETITIMQWGDGKHFYLKSSTGRLFEEKLNTYAAAEAVALKYVDVKHIRSHREYQHRHEGD